MTTAEVKKAVLEKPPGEQLEIIRASWSSFDSGGDGPISAQELALIDEAILEHEENPEKGVSWEKVKAELWPDL